MRKFALFPSDFLPELSLYLRPHSLDTVELAGLPCLEAHLEVLCQECPACLRPMGRMVVHYEEGLAALTVSFQHLEESQEVKLVRGACDHVHWLLQAATDCSIQGSICASLAIERECYGPTTRLPHPGLCHPEAEGCLVKVNQVFVADD